MNKVAVVITFILTTLPFPSKAIPPEQIKPVVNMTKDNWVVFRDYDGKQWIYFTHLETYTCGIKQVLYSINSEALDQNWELQPCDPADPHKITKDKIYLALPLGTAKTIAIKLIFNDNSESDVVHKTP
jgi:hypothetical protein